MKGDLRKASTLYKRRKYPEVIRLLEPQIFRFRQSYLFFYYVGMACLRTGDLGGASTYLQRGLGLKPNDIAAKLGLALVYLKRQDVQEAIRCYLEILETDPKNRQAQRGLAILQKDASPDRLIELDETGKLFRLLGEKRIGRTTTLVTAVTLLLAGILLVGFLWREELLFAGKPERNPEVESLTLADVGRLVDLTGDYRYILTEKEIKKTFDSVKKSFSRFEDNITQREINRILGANAAQGVKEQVRVIGSYLTEPDFTTLRNPFGFEEVLDDPFLHAGTYVIWKGKLSNLEVGTERIAFDLLVGYESNEVLLGVVPVVIDFAALLKQGDALEVLGQVVYLGDREFSLRGVSIHKLIDLEN